MLLPYCIYIYIYIQICMCIYVYICTITILAMRKWWGWETCRYFCQLFDNIQPCWGYSRPQVSCFRLSKGARGSHHRVHLKSCRCYNPWILMPPHAFMLENLIYAVLWKGACFLAIRKFTGILQYFTTFQLNFTAWDPNYLRGNTVEATTDWEKNSCPGAESRKDVLRRVKFIQRRTVEYVD